MSLSTTVRTLLKGALDQPRRSPRNHASSSSTTTTASTAKMVIDSLELGAEATAAATTSSAAATDLDLVVSNHGDENAEARALVKSATTATRFASTSKHTLDHSPDDELIGRNIYGSPNKRNKTDKIKASDSVSHANTSAERRRRNLKQQVANRQKDADSRSLRSTRSKTATTADIPLIFLDDDTPEPEISSSTSSSSESDCSSSKSSVSTDATSEDEETTSPSKKNVVALARESRKKLMAAKRSAAVQNKKALKGKAKAKASSALISKKQTKIGAGAYRVDGLTLFNQLVSEMQSGPPSCKGTDTLTVESWDLKGMKTRVVFKSDGATDKTVITDGDITLDERASNTPEACAERSTFLRARAADLGIDEGALKKCAAAVAVRQSAGRFQEVDLVEGAEA